MRYVAAAIPCFFLLGNTLALSAPPWVEDYCREKAFHANLAGRGAGEAFMARCIADFTPTPPKRRPYKKPRYYAACVLVSFVMAWARLPHTFSAREGRCHHRRGWKR